MNRRDAIFGPLALGASLRVWAQSPPLIVWIWPGTENGEVRRSMAFKQGMRESGMVQGRDYVLEERFADGVYDRFPAITDEVLARKPAILMVSTIASVRAAQHATRAVPIVFVSTNDPLGSGLIASYAHPGGNTTGLSSQNEDVVVKQLQLLLDLLPRAKRIAILVNPRNASGPKLFEHLRVSAAGLGIEAIAAEAGSPQGLEEAFRAVERIRPDALTSVPDALFLSERSRIAEFAAKNRLPRLGSTREIATDGGLASYGTSQPELFRRAATYAKKILAGARPADLPIEQPTKFELVINLKTAKSLGITVPQSLLLRADEVIQ